MTEITSNNESTVVVEPNNHDAAWVIVKKQKKRRPSPLCGIADPAAIKLRAVVALKYIHLWNMASDAEDIRQYLNQLYPADTCIVEELKLRRDYKSYKIGVPLAQYDQYFSTNVWPINAKIKPWINYRRTSRMTWSANNTEVIVSSQTFRTTNVSQQ